MGAMRADASGAGSWARMSRDPQKGGGGVGGGGQLERKVGWSAAGTWVPMWTRDVPLPSPANQVPVGEESGVGCSMM